MDGLHNKALHLEITTAVVSLQSDLTVLVFMQKFKYALDALRQAHVYSYGVRHFKFNLRFTS